MGGLGNSLPHSLVYAFVENELNSSEKASDTIYFISVQKGKKLINQLEQKDHKALEPYREEIPVELIERIRSSK